MTYQSIDDMIVDLETQRLTQQRAESDAESKIARLLKAANAQGLSTLTGADEAELDRLTALKRSAGDAVKKLGGALETAREVETEIAQNQAAAEITRPTGARLAGTRTADDGPRWAYRDNGVTATVGRTQRFVDHPVVADHIGRKQAADAHIVGHHGSLGQMIRAMTTTSGSAVVPQIWLGDIIDKARALSAVLLAGAEIVPMPAKTVNVGRLTGDPVAAFRAEGSTITASDPVFDAVVLDAKTMSTLVVGSLEWFMDADGVDQVVSDAIAQQLDLMCLFGGITTGGEVGATGFNTTFPTPPNPRGVLPALIAVASSSVLGSGANGSSQTALSYWNEILDTIFTVRQFNESPTGLIWSAKAAQQYAKAYDSTGQPIAVPAAVAEIPRFVSNQIPSFTQGTMTTRATDVFVGDWRQLLVGQRLDLSVQTLTERYSENGQIGIVAHWRGDVQPARPRAFSVYRYIQGA